MLLVQRLERKPQARRGARRQVLHQHVGTFQQFGQHVARLRVLHVQRQALFRTIGPDEVRRHAVDALVVGAGEVAAARAFDLDDARAEVGKVPRAERCGDGMFERDDRHAVEWANHD